jgi:hypothetical protein
LINAIKFYLCLQEIWQTKPCVKFFDELSPISMWIYELKLRLYRETDTVLKKPLMLIQSSSIILVQDKNTSLKSPVRKPPSKIKSIHVGVSPLQLVNLHRNRGYFVIKLHTWFCLSYFLKANITFYCIYQYFMSMNSFFNTVSVSRYSCNFNS